MTARDDKVGEVEREVAELRRRLAEREAELAHHKAELAAAIEQQTATAEVLQVINASPGDLAPVFDAMVEKATSLCDADFGMLWIYDGEGFRAEARHNVPPAYEEFLSTNRVVPAKHRLSGLRRLVEGEDLVLFGDLAVEADYPTAGIGVRMLKDSPAFSLPAAGGDRFVQYADVTQSEAHARIRTPLAEATRASSIRTLLLVPLRKGVFLGQIVAGREEVRPFSEKEIALLENFAQQAVIAMENARLITETREALEQQTATAEVLQVINSSPGELFPVFDAIVEKARHFCTASEGALRIFDGDSFHLVAVHGGAPDEVERLRQLGPIRASIAEAVGGPFARIAHGERIVHIPDMRETDFYRNHPKSRERVDLRRIRTWLGIALQKDEAILGAIIVHREEVRPFSDKEIALLRSFADQAVIAMENARLITETREALEQQTATAEVLQVINCSPAELTPVFDVILEKALRLCDASFGSFLNYDERAFRAAAHRNVPAEVADVLHRGTRLPLEQTRAAGGHLARIADGEDVIAIDDFADTEAYRTGLPIPRALVDLGGARAVVWVALRREERLLGVLVLYRQETRRFNESQIALLQRFADQAVIAMENARLLGELRQRTEEVAELNRGLEARVADQVEELGRVGKLKRFLAPQLAELIVSQGDEKILESHRREIVVVFCDLRGFTAFAETAEPEEVLELLREYHAALGPLVSQYEGTLDHFSGDGIMVFFNDPVPCPDPAERAVKMAVAMRAVTGDLISAWRLRDRELGFGVGVAQGYATLGQIGFADRSDYTAIGTVCNLASRLCAEAKDGQILLSGRVAAAVTATVRLEKMENLLLKGLSQPVSVFNVLEGAPAEVIPLHPRGQQPR